MEQKKKGYAGQMGHGGTQCVKAPMPGKQNTAKGTVVKTGNDLRNKAGK